MKKTREGLSIGLGVPTILVVFVILGMSMLSCLTYMKAYQNEKVVNLEIEYTTSYYEADSLAKYILSLDDYEAYVVKEDIEYKKEENSFSFYIPMKNAKLEVICIDDKVVSYHVVSEE